MGDDKNSGQVFDVNKPGKAEPDASGRPIIVGHRTMLKHDPMISSQSEPSPDKETPVENNEEPRQPTTLSHSSAAVVEPNQPAVENESETPKAEPSSIEVKSDDNPDLKEQSPSQEKAEETKDTKPAQTTAQEESKETPVNVAVTPVHPKVALDKAQKEEAVHHEAVVKLIDEKKYALPIGQKSRAAMRTTLIIVGVIAVLGIVFVFLQAS